MTDLSPNPVALPRVVIEDLTPAIDQAHLPVKRVVGEPVVVEAAIYADGHDRLWCTVVAEAPNGAETTAPMIASSPGLDLWEGTFVSKSEGLHRYRVLAWIDAFGTWSDGTQRKIAAGLDISSELLEGAAILDEAADRLAARVPGGTGTEADGAVALRAAATRLRSDDTTPMTDRAAGDRPSSVELFHASLDPATAATSVTVEVLVERERAQFSSWYELFPRSWGVAGEHGTFRDVEKHLDYVADMGFDILYLPPIHPIGRAFRKGPNNSEFSTNDDVGSPWAIGGPEGGHTAINPVLGTLDDFRSLVTAVDANGMELALDIAFQCSPDHPWVKEHPEWFKHRPDGTIQYAENPPKKYQDIYPLNYDSPDWRALWEACLDVFLYWAAEGVRVFRVDNPHTKPFAFWQWVIAETMSRYPDAMFLSEAFTRPRIMHRLAAVGFTQSYSYFPWRVTKAELTEYFTEVSTPPSVDELRPSAWPNTPDILPFHLMGARREMFALRVFLAALMAPSYGIYGPAFELGDNQSANNGKEEYGDSEKYQVRAWDRTDPASLRDLITDLNRLRSENLALHTLRTIRFHPIDNDQLLCFSKTTYAGPSVDPTDRYGSTILVIANLDDSAVQFGTVTLDLPSLGVDGSRPYEVHDLLTDWRFTWVGSGNYVELHPDVQPGHVFRITQQ